MYKNIFLFSGPSSCFILCWPKAINKFCKLFKKLMKNVYRIKFLVNPQFRSIQGRPKTYLSGPNIKNQTQDNFSFSWKFVSTKSKPRKTDVKNDSTHRFKNRIKINKIKGWPVWQCDQMASLFNCPVTTKKICPVRQFDQMASLFNCPFTTKKICPAA